MRVILMFFMLMGLSSFSWADYDEGIEYEVLKKAQPAPTDGTVEVIEFFSYGCPHCYRFEPFVEKWQEKKSDKVTFIRVPAVFSKNWEALASLYYASEVLGVQDKMHLAIFEAMHGSGKKIHSMEDLKKLFTSNGISIDDLNKALGSFTVAAKTRKAKAMTASYAIKSVPNIVVQGKYLTNGTLAQNHDNVFKVVDYLTAEINKENAPEKK